MNRLNITYQSIILGSFHRTTLENVFILLFAQRMPIVLSHTQQRRGWLKFHRPARTGETIPRTSFQALVAAIYLIPHFLPVSGFKSPRYSMVRYERHLSELSLKGSSNAFVGQASRQRVHEPH